MLVPLLAYQPRTFHHFYPLSCSQKLPAIFSFLPGGTMKVLLLLFVGFLSTVTAEKCGAAQRTEVIEAQEGDKVTLQCDADRQIDLRNSTLTCRRTDGNFSDSSQCVFSSRHGVEDSATQIEQYKNRTHLVFENLRKGILSLEIFPVQPSDSGQYKCYIGKICCYTVTVIRRNRTDAVIMTTASAEATTNPVNGTEKPSERIAVIRIVLPTVIAVVVLFAVGLIGVLWKLKICGRSYWRSVETEEHEDL